MFENYILPSDLTFTIVPLCIYKKYSKDTDTDATPSGKALNMQFKRTNLLRNTQFFCTYNGTFLNKNSFLTFHSIFSL